MLSKELYRTYIQILKDELVPAMGCTEPIAIAYAGAVARKTLGVLPERVEVAVSRNIIKNVKSVVVPHTGAYAESKPQQLPESWQEMLRRNWRSSPMWNRKTSKRWEAS